MGNAEFIGNSAISGGGAIWSMGPYIFQVSKAIFQSNGAELGGAIYVGSTNGIETEFSGCTFEGNEATDGGAVYLYTGTGVDAFTKCMFRDNYASESLSMFSFLILFLISSVLLFLLLFSFLFLFLFCSCSCPCSRYSAWFHTNRKSWTRATA